jgi:putative ABC transport system substrate-binding protein
MNRRRAIASLLALGTGAGAPSGRAQSRASAGRRTLGVLSLVHLQVAEKLWLGALRDRLRVHGWIEGENLAIELAFAEFKAGALPALAEGLVRKRVDVIHAFLSESAVAAARATRTIPIVFCNVPWPVEHGLVDAFARPGRNATGVSNYTGIEVSTKRLEFLRTLAPDATRLSWILASPTEQTVDGAGFDLRPLLDPAARGLGFEARYHPVPKIEELDAVFANVLASRPQVLSVAASGTLDTVRERIAAFASSNRLPTACASVRQVEAGGLLSYQTRGGPFVGVPRSADYVDRIFRGARPADLPVDRPTEFELTINLGTARALGLRIPQSLLLQAGRVIE